MVNKMDFQRQTGIFNPNNQKLNIHIIGAGSTGSFIALNLAKLGFKSIKITDFDEVEEHNIPNQFYRMSDVGKLKTDALAEIVEDFTGTKLIKDNVKITDEYEFDDIDMNTVIVYCLDNMETRKLVYEKIKDYPIKIVDTRMGGDGFQVFTVDLGQEEQVEKFEKALEGVTAETVCGEKSVIYTILNIASETCNIIKRIDKEERVPCILKREMPSYRFICDMK